MEKILENLDEIILNGNQGDIPNPDSFTVLLSKSKPSLNVIARALGISHENSKLEEMFKNLNFDSDYNKIIEVLRNANDAKLSTLTNSVADVIEEMKSTDGINLKGKSVFPVLWAATIYVFITNKNLSHKNITSFKNALETIPYIYLKTLKGLSDAEKNLVSNIGHNRKEVQSIFQDSELNIEVNNYLAKAFTRNEIWEELYKKELWYKSDTLELIDINTKSISINSEKDLVDLLSKPDPNNYQAVIDYIKENYFSEKEETEALYQSYMTVGFIASALLKDENIVKTEDKHLFKDIAFNIYVKIAGSKASYEKLLNNKNITSNISAGSQEKIIKSILDANSVAANIMSNTITVDTDDTNENETNTKTPTIKIGNRASYIKAYLNLFESLVVAKEKYYNSKYDAINKIKSSSKEMFLIETAKEFNISGLKDEVEIPNKVERFEANKQIILNGLDQQNCLIGNMTRVLSSLRKKFKDDLDITINRKIVGAYTKITEATIQEFYKLIATDPILKQDKITYRLLPSSDMRLAELRKRAEANPGEYPLITGLIKMPTKQIIAQKTAYELYVNEEGTPNEEFKELYETIKDTKTSAEQKETALKNVEKDITAEQLKTIQEYIDLCKKKEKAAREKEEAKKKEQENTQLTIDIPENIDEDEKE